MGDVPDPFLFRLPSTMLIWWRPELDVILRENCGFGVTLAYDFAKITVRARFHVNTQPLGIA